MRFKSYEQITVHSNGKAIVHYKINQFIYFHKNHLPGKYICEKGGTLLYKWANMKFTQARNGVKESYKNYGVK